MIPVLNKEPEVTEAILAAIRSRTKFVTAGANISGFHSAYTHAYLIQASGALIAAYDKFSEQWFIRNDGYELVQLTAKQMLVDALGAENLIAVPFQQLRQIQKQGFVAVVRKRLNVAKEK